MRNEIAMKEFVKAQQEIWPIHKEQRHPEKRQGDTEFLVTVQVMHQECKKGDTEIIGIWR